jgi:thiaminase/transcriptional activator TenA
LGQRLSVELWDGITEIYDAILGHPFVTGLADGSLSPSAFAFYVVQDTLYLEQYALALAAVASRAPDGPQAEMFARHAAGVITVERAVHQSLLAELDIDPQAAAAAEPAPTTLAYTSYLLAVTRGRSYAEGVAAVLPCYWIYQEVGRELLRRGSPDPRYRKWIAAYGGEEFAAEVSGVLAVTDALGPVLGTADRAAMHRHFRATSRYEWMFWDMGYREEAWPV